jgi:hypothetical protein
MPGAKFNPANNRDALRGLRTSVEQTVAFGVGGNATDHQLHGWSVAESGFGWTDGTESALSLRCPGGPYGGFIEIAVSPFGVQHIRVKTNGRLIGETTVTHGTVLAYHCEVFQDEHLVLTLELPDAKTPNEVVSKPRWIALAVQSVVVSSLLDPWRPVPRLDSRIDLAASDEVGALSAARTITRLPPAELATRFENLIGNCELGFFQRKCGAEPLSLLRFADAVAQSIYSGCAGRSARGEGENPLESDS